MNCDNRAIKAEALFFLLLLRFCSVWNCSNCARWFVNGDGVVAPAVWMWWWSPGCEMDAQENEMKKIDKCRRLWFWMGGNWGTHRRPADSVAIVSSHHNYTQRTERTELRAKKWPKTTAPSNRATDCYYYYYTIIKLGCGHFRATMWHSWWSSW